MGAFDKFMPKRLSKPFFGDRQKPRLPDGLRVYAIGDIHGSADLLDQMLAAITQDCETLTDGRARLVFLGDYIDRGPDSPGVLDRLIALKASGVPSIYLKGNHEDELLGFLDNPSDHVHWLEWGGEETLENYGVRAGAARDVVDIAADLRAAIPPAHVNFLNALEIRHEVGDYLFVHAGIKPGVPIDEQTDYDQMWIRGEFHRTEPEQRPDKVIIHGHQSAKKVVDKGWRVCVDTGAVWNGTLTAIVLEGTQKRFLPVSRAGRSHD